MARGPNYCVRRLLGCSLITAADALHELLLLPLTRANLEADN